MQPFLKAVKMRKKEDIFLIFAQNIDCGYMLEQFYVRTVLTGNFNEYPQFMFESKNKNVMYTPVNPNFTK